MLRSKCITLFITSRHDMPFRVVRLNAYAWPRGYGIRLQRCLAVQSRLHLWQMPEAKCADKAAEYLDHVQWAKQKTCVQWCNGPRATGTKQVTQERI